MLGTLRLILALMVALSHAGVRWQGLNPGVIAVVGFYAISGYVMTVLLRRHYGRLAELPRFYADRALRLAPGYYAVALLAVLVFLWRGPIPPFLERAPGWTDWLNNLLVVPLNYFMWNGSDRFALIPPAWSLGAEVQFYLVFPLLLLPGLRGAALAASLGIYLLAFAGIIQTEWFGYRLLPGVLFMFLLGSWLADLHASAAPRRAGGLAWGVAAAAGLLALAGGAAGSLPLPYNPETLLGLALALPLLHLLAPRARLAWDEQAGDLSYGLFLCHFLVFWAWPGAEQGAAALAARLFAALALAFLIHRAVENPVLALRRRLRKAKGV